MIAGLEWKDEYEVGVEVIDNAHKEMFRIANRFFILGQDENKHKWIAEEGVKFLKAYVIRHFSEEESYMLSIRYTNLPHHAEQHRIMREVVLPRMESQLRHEKFSADAVNRFLRIIQLWLSRHILVHDLDIGKANRSFPLT